MKSHLQCLLVNGDFVGTTGTGPLARDKNFQFDLGRNLKNLIEILKPSVRQRGRNSLSSIREFNEVRPLRWL